MLRTKVDPQTTLWESLLPEEFRRLPPGLSAIDSLLDDPVFFEPFFSYFDPQFGRPSIPIETYLRLMHLRFLYRLGFETLCAEVTDSLSWRRFCRIGPYDNVPDASTLMKITKRCGDDVVSELNDALLAKADASHLVKLDKVRADTTVVPANVAYPTDSGLLTRGVAKLTGTVSSLKKMGFASRTRFRDRTRSVRRRAHSVGAWLRRRNDDAKAEVLVITGELLGDPREEGVIVRDDDRGVVERVLEVLRDQAAFAVVVPRVGRLQHSKAIADRDSWGDDKEAVRESGVAGTERLVRRLPGNEHRHDDRLTRACSHLDRDAGHAVVLFGVVMAQACAEVRLAVPPGNLGQVDSRLRRFSLTEQDPVLPSSVCPVQE